VPFGGISVVAIKGGAQVAVGAAMVQSGSATIDLHPVVSLPKSSPSSKLNILPWPIAQALVEGTPLEPPKTP